jgi:hypothetical protein
LTLFLRVIAMLAGAAISSAQLAGKMLRLVAPPIGWVTAFDVDARG